MYLGSPTEPYGALRSHTEHYGALQSPTEPYEALQSPRGFYRALQSPRGPYGALQSPTEPYRALRNPTEPYGALQLELKNSQRLAPRIRWGNCGSTDGKRRLGIGIPIPIRAVAELPPTAVPAPTHRRPCSHRLLGAPKAPSTYIWSF